MSKIGISAPDQLAQALLEKIEHRVYLRGHRLPTAREIAKQYQVGLATVQQAFRKLSDAGVIVCRVGDGTYVEQPPVKKWTKPVAIWPGNPIDAHLACSYRDAIIGAIHDALHPYGASLRLMSFDSRKQSIQEFEGMIQDHCSEVSGFITFPIIGDHPVEPFFERLTVPWVMVNQSSHAARWNFVATDFYAGAREIGEHLASTGVRNVWVFESNVRQGYYSSLLRLRGLQDGFLKAGHFGIQSRIEQVDCGDEEGGYTLTASLLDAHPAPDAIVCAGDFLAFGAMRALKERGLRIPEDVSVVGQTGVEASKHTSPSLSVLQLPLKEIGIQCARMLVQQAETRSRHLPGVLVSAEFIRRQSVRAAA